MTYIENAKATLATAFREGASVEGGAYASMATAHAVLALIDIIQGDRETEIQDARSYILQLEKANRALQLRVQELSDQLDGCYDTLRRHEQAATANTNPNNNDLRKSHE